MTGRKVAIVSAWFGSQLPGEDSRVRRLLHFLQSLNFEIEIFTTNLTGPSRFTEEDQVSETTESTEEILGTTVHRYPLLDRRDAMFYMIQKKLLTHHRTDQPISPLSEKEEQIYFHHYPGSEELNEIIARKGYKYEFIFFVGIRTAFLCHRSLFARTNAIFIPIPENTGEAKLEAISIPFYESREIIFQSREELELAVQLYGPSLRIKSSIGFLPFPLRKPRNKKAPSISHRKTLLYISDPASPGTDELVFNLYQNYRKQTGNKDFLRLLIVGNQQQEISGEGILSVDLLKETDPAVYFSRASAILVSGSGRNQSDLMFLAMQESKPIFLINRDELHDMVFQNAGSPGYSAVSPEETIQALIQLEKVDPGKLSGKAIPGLETVKKLNSITSFSEVFQRLEQNRVERKNRTRASGVRVHQVLPTLSSGDAISNQAIYFKNIMKEMGIESRILVENREAQVSSECEYYSRLALQPEDGLIYHHSIGTGLTSEFSRMTGPRFLIYHNITPPDFFLPYDRNFAGILKKGIIDLGRLASSFNFAVGDSNFNRSDLEKKGFHTTHVLPILVDPNRWATPVDRKVIENYNDTTKNIIFVGRLAPNKKQEDLVEMFFHMRKSFPSSRLILVGDGSGNASYVHMLYERIRKYGLSDRVFITGKVTESQLHAYYRIADLFVSMSEHEGFGVPLIESMWFDIPVLAYKAGAVPETMRDAGVLFSDKSDFSKIADIACTILEDEEIQRKIILGQRKLRERYSPETLLPRYQELLHRFFLTPQVAPTLPRIHASKNKPRIAFVVRRAGVEVTGGSDRYCLDLALKMKDRWNIHILTTCALDPSVRENFYPEGEEEIDGVVIHRFPVDRPSRFRPIPSGDNPQLMEQAKTSSPHARKWVALQGPGSSTLLRHLKSSREQYDAYVFFSYKSAVTYPALPLVQDRAFLVPASTGEEALDFPIWDSFFSRPEKLFFLTEEEQADFTRRFPSIANRGIFVGTGLNPAGVDDSVRFTNQFGIQEPYLLYLDDIDEKGAIPIVNHFIRFRNENPVRIKLVLAGTPQTLLPAHPDIIITGHIPEDSIRDAIEGAVTVLIPVPRDNPPFSILEAWNRDKAVLVDGNSGSLVELCRRHSGGLWYKNFEEFQEAVLYLLETPRLAGDIKERIRDTYDWRLAMERIQSAVESILPRPRPESE